MTEIHLNETKSIQLQILQEVVKIADKYSIPYFLYYGTLIGCIRHKGFIPWDDDIDIVLLRENYDRLLTVLQKDLPDAYWLQTNILDNQYWNPFAKVRKLGTLMREKDQEWIPDEKCGIWIDIFPLDDIHKRNVLTDLKNFLVNTITLSLKSQCYSIPISSFSRRYRPFMLIEKVVGREKLIDFQEKLLRSGSGDFCCYLAESSKYEKGIIPKRYLEDYIYGEFEGRNFKIPRNYDEILTLYYGEYMKLPPIEERKGHNLAQN